MSSTQSNKLKIDLKRIPDSPGVYLMKNGKGRIVYVGKAKKLSGRVRSYLQAGNSLDAKTRALMESVDEVDYIATGNEVEALVLECNLIKEYRPRYNIRLKDDKRYPFIKLTLNEEFPRLVMVRRIENDGAEYFGPYTDAGAVRRTLGLMSSILPLRRCKRGKMPAGKKRECLNFHIKRCLGPCTGRVEKREYDEIVRQVKLFLKGKNSELNIALRKRMKRLAGEKRYEEAAVVRNQIESLEKIAERQLAISPSGNDEDIVALAREGNKSCGVVMKIREGKILGSETFIVPSRADDEDKRIFTAFFELYYHSATDIPPRIFTQMELHHPDLLRLWLAEKTNRRVTVSVPRKGDKKKLVELASKNASLRVLSEIRSGSKSLALLIEAKKILGLPSTPKRIEAYDISNIQGTDAVGSMVTFENGNPLKSGYRHFKIRRVDGIDDFAMLEEVLRRRLEHLKEGRGKHPDLILVDGGIGQLSSARKAMEETGITGIQLIGLAKKHEEIHREGKRGVLVLPRRSGVLRLLQRIRDEAHRFAVEYHRKLRSKRLEASELDVIPGIGEKRKVLLLVEFGSLESIRKASVDEIASVPGIGRKVAGNIYERLHR